MCVHEKFVAQNPRNRSAEGGCGLADTIGEAALEDPELKTHHRLCAVSNRSAEELHGYSCGSWGRKPCQMSQALGEG